MSRNIDVFTNFACNSLVYYLYFTCLAFYDNIIQRNIISWIKFLCKIIYKYDSTKKLKYYDIFIYFFFIMNYEWQKIFIIMDLKLNDLLVPGTIIAMFKKFVLSSSVHRLLHLSIIFQNRYFRHIILEINFIVILIS